jgi:hypothetical protein
MNSIALVCANFGAIDKVQSLPAHEGIDAFYYTDEATLAKAAPEDVATWTRVLTPNYPRHDFDSRLRSRYFKHQIHRLDEVRDHRWLVWFDASMKFRETAFLHEQTRRLGELPPEQRVLLVPHPERQTIQQEYEHISAAIARGDEGLSARYAKEKMAEQMAYYAQRGWNLGLRVYCGGFWIVENSDRFAHVWDDWWDQNLRFGMMDQLSLPVMLEKNGCRPQALDVLVWNNPHFHFVFRGGLPGLVL